MVKSYQLGFEKRHLAEVIDQVSQACTCSFVSKIPVMIGRGFHPIFR
ncbi:MAG: hypothetical protein WCO29_18745 [Nostocales cyanobacterium ELA583]